MPLSLLTSLDGHVRKRPDAPFLTITVQGEEDTYSFSRFQAEALDFARRFQALGTKPDDVVFIVLKHGAALYTAFVGAMYAGAIPSFLPFPTPKQDADHYWSSHRALFQHVKPAVVLTYGANMAPVANSLAGLTTALVDIDALPPAAGPMRLDRRDAPGETAFLQHSSGTTGLKKGVMLSFGKVAAQVASYSAVLDFGPQDIIASWLPVYHDMGLISSFIMPLTVGAQVVSVDAFEWVARPPMLMELIERHRATFCWLPNFAFNHLATTRPKGRVFDLSCIRSFISCSEPCKTETFEKFGKLYAADGVRPEMLTTCFAMAEAVFAVSQSVIGAAPRTVSVDLALLSRENRVEVVETASRAGQFLSNGTPVPGIDLRINTEDGPVVWSPGANTKCSGEIEIRGVSVFNGYYKNIQYTEAAFSDGWYRTGDIGFLFEGELYICGRMKEMLIVNGRNYYANDIEEICGSIKGIKPGRAVAFALFDERTQSEVAVVVAEMAEPMDPGGVRTVQRAVKQAVFDRLELTLQRVLLVEVGWLIKTTSGKIVRDQNALKYRASLGKK